MQYYYYLLVGLILIISSQHTHAEANKYIRYPLSHVSQLLASKSCKQWSAYIRDDIELKPNTTIESTNPSQTLVAYILCDDSTIEQTLLPVAVHMLADTRKTKINLDGYLGTAENSKLLFFLPAIS